MKWRCKECGAVHDEQPIICNAPTADGNRCGSFEFRCVQKFQRSPDGDTYEDRGQ